MPKSKYETHVAPNLPLIEKWARDGLSQQQIAENLGIASSTFYSYINAYSELSDTLMANRDIANATVVNTLYQSCIGFDYGEQVMTPKGDIREITRYAKPNVAAMIFWLKNKLPEEWNDKHEVGVSGELRTTHEQTQHVIHELVSDPVIAAKVRENFRRRMASERGGD